MGDELLELLLGSNVQVQFGGWVGCSRDLGGTWGCLQRGRLEAETQGDGGLRRLEDPSAPLVSDVSGLKDSGGAPGVVH